MKCCLLHPFHLPRWGCVVRNHGGASCRCRGSGRAGRSRSRSADRGRSASLRRRGREDLHDHALIQSRADWVNATYVNDDTDAVAAFWRDRTERA